MRRFERAQPKPRDLAFLLFALPLLVYLVSGPVFYGYDGEIMYRVSESLVLRHSIAVTDPIYHYLQPYSPYGIGTSLVLLPFVALGQLLIHDPRALVILYLPMVTALTVVAVNALFNELGVSRIWAAGLSLIFAFGTMAWHYSGVMFSEPLLALMLVLALLSLLRFRRSGQRRWMLAAGAAAGAAVLARDDSLFLVLVPLTIYAAVVGLRGNPSWASRAQSALAWVVPIAAAGLGALAYHLARYGWGSGPYANDGIGFTQPLLGGLYGLLLSPGAGLLVFVPVLALAFFGFPEFFRRWRAEASLIAALVAVRFLFFAGWWDWAGGATWGPRYLVPLLPLMLVPVAFLPAGWWRKAALGLGMVGLGIEVLDQLVPYGLYYGTIVPQLAKGLGVCECVPGPGRATLAIHNLMAFDWHYAPLVGQTNDLLHGIVAPAWAPIAALALPLVAIVSAGLGLQIWRLARRLEAVEMAEAA
jgi:hypothetical protein